MMKRFFLMADNAAYFSMLNRAFSQFVLWSVNIRRFDAALVSTFFDVFL